MMKGNQFQKGVTLVEILLVVVIATSIVMMFLGYITQTSQQTRRDIATMQIQQILNAALAYYVNNGGWPESTAAQVACTNASGGDVIGSGDMLTTNNYLQKSSNWNGPYGNGYRLCVDSVTNYFYLVSRLPTGISTTPANAATIAAQLPSGVVIAMAASGNTLPTYVSGTGFTQTVAPGSLCATTNCFVATSVPPPGQNLNNARSVNFAAVYHASSCVPAPACPTGMIPQIFVVPTSISGVNDQPTCTSNSPSSCTANVYPISSYTAYAVGSITGLGNGNYNYVGAPFDLTTTTSTMPACTSGNTAPCYSSISTTAPGTTSPIATAGYYWRVCLGVITERGKVTPSTASNSAISPWGMLEGTVMAITRCVPGSTTTGIVSEPVGSNFTVFNSNGN